MSLSDDYYQMGRDASDEIYKPLVASLETKLAEANSRLILAQLKITELLQNIVIIDDCICNDKEDEALMFISEILNEDFPKETLNGFVADVLVQVADAATEEDWVNVIAGIRGVSKKYRIGDEWREKFE